VLLLRVTEVCLQLELLPHTLEETTATLRIRYLSGGDIPHVLNPLIHVLKFDILLVSS
jgi:hypothetical protein